MSVASVRHAVASLRRIARANAPRGSQVVPLLGQIDRTTAPGRHTFGAHDPGFPRVFDASPLTEAAIGSSDASRCGRGAGQKRVTRDFFPNTRATPSWGGLGVSICARR